jgi:hypothetical protein
MASVDDFRIIAYIFFMLTPVALFMRKPAAQSPAPQPIEMRFAA